MTQSEYATKLAMYQTSDAPTDVKVAAILKLKSQYEQTKPDMSSAMVEQTDLSDLIQN